MVFAVVIVVLAVILLRLISKIKEARQVLQNNDYQEVAWRPSQMWCERIRKIDSKIDKS